MKHNKSKVILRIFFLLINSFLWSQEPVFVHLAEEDGLPDIEFYDIIEDKDGFIWLAADSGLFRYDGKEYKKYANHKQRGFSVFNLRVDEKNRVWCNNLSGQFFYIENDSLKLFIDIKDKVNNIRLPDYIITKDFLKVSSDKGLSIINRKTKKITQKNISQDVTPDIFALNNKTYFLGSDLFVYDDENREIDRINLKERIINKRLFFLNNSLFLHYKQLDKTSILMPDSDGKSYLYKIDKYEAKENILPKELIGQTIIEITELENEVWFCTTKGVYVYSNYNNKLFFIKSFLKNEYVTKVIKDKWNNVWITTLSNGVYIIPNRGITRKSMPLGAEDKVTSMVFVNDYFISGTKKGLLILENQKTKKTTVLNVSNKIGKIKELVVDNTLTNLLVVGLHRLAIFNLKNYQYKVIKSGASKKVNFLSKDTLLTSKHSMFIMTFIREIKAKTKGVNLENSVLSKNKDNNVILKTIKNERSYNNYVSTNGKHIYESSAGVLTYFDKKNNFEPTEIKIKGKSIFALSYSETSDEIVWISTSKYGILGVKEKQVVYQYDKKKMPLLNQPLKILADGNNLWATTRDKICYVDREKKQTVNFNFKDEIPVQKIIDLKLYKNKLYVLGNKEIIVIDKVIAMQKPTAPEVYFSQVYYGGKEKLISSFYSIPYDENSFEVNFNVNGFNSKNTITYLYRLKGLENDWKNTTSRKVRYPSIPYGNYTFQIKAKSYKGKESEEIKEIVVEIQKPFWFQWWFIIVVVLIFWGLLFLRIKKIKKNQKILLLKERLDKDLVLSRLENLRIQMNPHFIFNALNSIQNYILKNDKITASLYLSDFSELIRMYLNHSRKTEIRLIEELNAMKKYLKLENIRFGEKLQYFIEVGEEVDINLMKVPPLLIQPYVENSLKHGLFYKKSECILKLNFQYNKEKDALICCIMDNGIGRKQALEIKSKKKHGHMSFATKANKDRIDLLNKGKNKEITVETIDLFTQENKVQGTKIIVTIPQ